MIPRNHTQIHATAEYDPFAQPFRRSLLAANKAPRTVETYMEAVTGLHRYLFDQGMPLAPADGVLPKPFDLKAVVAAVEDGAPGVTYQGMATDKGAGIALCPAAPLERSHYERK